MARRQIDLQSVPMGQGAALIPRPRRRPLAPDDITTNTFARDNRRSPPGLAFGESDDRLRDEAIALALPS